MQRFTEYGQAITAFVLSLFTAVGSLSFLQGSSIVISILCGVAVTISTLRLHRAKMNLIKIQSRGHGKSEVVD